MEFTPRFLRYIEHYAALQGVSLDLPGVDRSAVRGSDQERLVSAATVDAALIAAVDATGDAHFGLHLAVFAAFPATGIIGHIAENSPDVRTALTHVCEHRDLIARVLAVDLVEDERHARLRYRPDPAWVARHAESARHVVDTALVLGHAIVQRLVNDELKPIRLERRGPEGAPPAPYASVFGCPVRYDSPDDALVWDVECLDRAIIGRDQYVYGVLLEHAAVRLASLQRESPLAERVKQHILSLARPVYPAIKDVAKRLHMSVRSLQRRLQEEGYTYKQVTDELREESAQRYLRHSDLSIGEIAYLLGYTESGAFIRAFRRWTGTTPAQFREV